MTISEKASLLLQGWTIKDIEIYEESMDFEIKDTVEREKAFIQKLEEKFNGYKKLKNWEKKHN